MNTIIYRTKTYRQNVPTLSTLHSPLSTTHHAFTLIELLVVMSIMVLLVAVSVPMLKPMFESQKTKNAAQTVAAALQRVRFKAMEKQETYGILFAPFENQNDVAVQMRLVKMGNASINTDPALRVRIVNRQIFLCQFDLTSSTWNNVDQTLWDTEWNSKVENGYRIQLGRQGRLLELAIAKADIASSVYPTLASPYNNLTFPENSSSDALEYKIIQQPRSSLSPPVVLPRGTVIDLAYSSGCNAPEDLTNYNKNKLYFNGDIQNILFTPSGYVDYFNGNYNPYYGGLIYLCIGEWERGFNPSLAEDGKNNIQTMTNFWVTLNPQTGQIRVTEMAPISEPNDIQGARKFAAEHFGINEQ
ncbi:MAG: prepilin-type N-terminal cleavage/methylation domain-containing protein [Planctomycetaceae bacterium]|nr:prepilin-type N-terminal cleavage/methylation domain-containing protein [Planctomycetaceae bacterium]